MSWIRTKAPVGSARSPGGSFAAAARTASITAKERPDGMAASRAVSRARDASSERKM
jgi:hypothetical protein